MPELYALEMLRLKSQLEKKSLKLSHVYSSFQFHFNNLVIT